MIDEPSISQTAIAPSVFWKAMPDNPSPVKSPVAIACHDEVGLLARTTVCAGLRVGPLEPWLTPQ